jgi:TM2 domain-containing membrane protein YozV
MWKAPKYGRFCNSEATWSKNVLVLNKNGGQNCSVPFCAGIEVWGLNLESNKSKSLAVVLAIFLGSFGAHKFYLGRMRTGVVYLLFSWTGITFFVALFDALNLMLKPAREFRGRTPAYKTNQNAFKPNLRANSKVLSKPARVSVESPIEIKKPVELFVVPKQLEPLDALAPAMKPISTEKFLAPEQEIEDLWNRFLDQREVLEKFRIKFSELEAESDQNTFPHFLFNADIKLKYLGKTHVVSHQSSRLYDGLLHKKNCVKLDKSNHANGWEYRFTGDIAGVTKWAAQELLNKSPLLRQVIREQQGLWRIHIQYLLAGYLGSTPFDSKEKPAYLSDANYQLLSASGLIDFERLVPGFCSDLLRLFDAKGISISRERHFRDIISGSQGIETQEVDRISLLSQLAQEVETEINELRPTCLHFDKIDCLLCGMDTEPNLISNMALNLPNEICAWCFKLIDYHDLSIRKAGRSLQNVKDEAVLAFRLAVKYFEFSYWQSPVLRKQVIVSLGLRNRDPNEIRIAAAILAAMPRDLMGFQSDRHFFAETGLEHLLPPDKSRGKKSISRCGHLCLSLGEREICEFLFSNDIHHTREPDYTSLTGLQDLTEFGFMRGDFLVGNTVIEFAGLRGNPEYDLKMEKKKALCDKYNIDLIVVNPDEIKDLSKSLARLKANR